MDALKTGGAAASPTLDPATADLQAQLDALQKENDRLKAEKSRASSPSVKPGPKGTFCVYGFGANPLTLYSSGWSRLLDQGVLDLIREGLSLAEEMGMLSHKGADGKAVNADGDPWQEPVRPPKGEEPGQGWIRFEERKAEFSAALTRRLEKATS